MVLSWQLDYQIAKRFGTVIEGIFGTDCKALILFLEAPDQSKSLLALKMSRIDKCTQSIAMILLCVTDVVKPKWPFPLLQLRADVLDV